MVTCHPAGMTPFSKDRTDGQKYGPEYYSERGEDCPPVMMCYGRASMVKNTYIFRNGNRFAHDMHQ